VHLGQTMGLATVAEGSRLLIRPPSCTNWAAGTARVLVRRPMSGEALERLIDQPQPGRHAPESPAESGVGHEQSANDLVAREEAR
jgi:hypothetical protein